MQSVEHLQSGWWDNRYRTGQTAWDLGKVSRPVMRLLECGALKPCRVLIPGCGSGYEIVELTRRGFRVTGLDFSPLVLRRARAIARKAGVRVAWRSDDFFRYAARTRDRFEAILEQTFFCAVGPTRWNDYVDAVHRLLRPRGILTGVFFDFKSDGGGPPFSIERKALRDLFARRFAVETLQRCRWSDKGREGIELLAIFRKKSIAG